MTPPTPINPFFYLRGDGFWHHRASEGKETAYQALSGPGGAGRFSEVVDFAYLDDELFQLVLDPANRAVLRRAIVDRYFPGQKETVLELAREEEQIGQYRQHIEGQIDGIAEGAGSYSVQEAVRDIGFRRVVTRAYDYRCAACGLRVILPEGLSLVDAAHIVPFSLTQDDDPRNGIALCKNHHWAMDSHLIAPGTDLKWRVAPVLDDRIEGQREMLELHRRKVLLPAEDRYSPKPESLEWVEKQLLTA